MMRMLRAGGCFLAAAAVLLTLAGFIAPAALAAEGERVLDPELSLIGGCKAEELDPVEDPGCPTTPPTGNHPPAGLFAFPRAVTADSFGDIYVANWGAKEDGSEGRIDIFNPEGRFISEIPSSVIEAPQAIAVDSAGTLYAWQYNEGKLFRFDPCAPYNPAGGEIDYCEPPSAVSLIGPECGDATECPLRNLPGYRGLAINPQNDHLFFAASGQVVEYGSAAEGNQEIRWIRYNGSGTGVARGIAVDSVRQRLYVDEGGTIGIYYLADGLPAQEKYERIGSIEGSAVPQGHFGSALALAVDEGTGSLYVYDNENAHLWELDKDGNYVATVDFPFESAINTAIAIDNGPSSPNGKLSEDEGRGRYLYVPSHPKKSPGHLFAFFMSIVNAPKVESVLATNISEDEAELQARINPGNAETTYTFELKPEGAAEWAAVGMGSLAAGNLDVEASVAVTGLTPGTHYRFRVLATNEKGSAAPVEGSFATYPNLASEPNPCPNALLRTGISALLPDCRAYELVTPADTNAHPPLGPVAEGGGGSTRLVSPAGDKVPFRSEGGSLPGFDATGSLLGDPYLATRTATGWTTSLIGPSGAEAISDGPGTTSPDQGYSFWGASSGGSAVLEDKYTFYVRYPDGHSELIGQGSLGFDPEATGRLISEGGGHIIFSTGARANSVTAVQLEPQAPDKTAVIYDRTPDGVTHVVSLKPGDAPFAQGEDAKYAGSSADGTGVAFEVKGTLYLRYKDEQTFQIGKGVQFAGVAEGGGRVFYVEGGDLKAFDVGNPLPIVFANATAEVVPVTVSTDGSTAYFLSKSVIAGSGANPEGVKPKAGGQNLYRSREGQVTFIGTVTERDVLGASGLSSDGLGLWLSAVGPAPEGLGEVPARSTPDGSVFLFKSRAPLTGYESEGHAEIYRYDSAAKQLQCLSCNPTGVPASSDATLQSERLGLSLPWPENLRADGHRAFFESSEPLVARDGDGLQDVYEWEDQGVGSCSQAGGCLYLISSPQSRRAEYLYSVSRSGDDVFFISSDLLVGADTDETPSIYDARVGGGFAEPTQGVCEGEGCRSQLAPAPILPAGDTPVRGAGDNVKPRHCGKGKRRIKHRGKVRCVKKGHHRKHRAHATQKGGRR